MLNDIVFNLFEKIKNQKWLVWSAGIILAAALLMMPMLDFAQKNLWVRIIGYAGLYIILGLGLLIHVGFAGMLDLGFAAFYAIGAYSMAFLASPHFDIHLSFWVVLFIGGGVAAFVGAFFSIPLINL